MDTLWRIERLAQLAAEALNSGDYAGQDSARIREVPDVRTIRYYTTLGMIDRPAEMRGRTAYYGRRHLRQLLAIKNLQARGLSLEEIQQTLAGISERKLTQLAALPEGFFERLPAVGGESLPRPAKRKQFWAETPRVAEQKEGGSGDPPYGPLALPVDAGAMLILTNLPTHISTQEVHDELLPALDALRAALAALRNSHPSPPQEPPL
jgi:DNA-binding transcriptional MerR regulator